MRPIGFILSLALMACGTAGDEDEVRSAANGAASPGPVRLSDEDRQALVGLVSSLEIGAEIGAVRRSLPVPFVEQELYTKEPPRRKLFTNISVVLVRDDPGLVNELKDQWIDLRFDLEGRLYKIYGHRVLEIESRSVEDREP